MRNVIIQKILINLKIVKEVLNQLQNKEIIFNHRLHDDDTFKTILQILKEHLKYYFPGFTVVGVEFATAKILNTLPAEKEFLLF